ncbi:hypothetical protein L1427_000315 [Listeria monocytogenes]|nr:hypothetical protein [Listeria monocytogenes]EAF2623592.1 hypothetical protein [Listeria monocytogenes]EAG2020661.1 hypothetical protein [Listeria monocytogenes]EFQ6801140.1 hypothetical protein [Listeria monocytogenes]EHO6106610.1 hypothetical protein [Listeria monocytogenes]
MKIKEALVKSIKSENNYEESVQNFDILTEKMEDDFIPYRVEQNVMMWLNDDGIIGEIECIFPTQIEQQKSLIEEEDTLVLNGFPLVDTEENVFIPEVKVFKNNNYFMLYLSESCKYNKIIISENLTFYVNNTELIAIRAIQDK